jgi:enoyl-CoA hydratase/carnithine racemase
MEKWNGSSVAYAVAGRRATITLNRPDRLNAIDEHMPAEIREAVERANADRNVHVIIITGAGRAFCAATTSRTMPNAKARMPASRRCRGTRWSISA